jgi:hypothetical protein
VPPPLPISWSRSGAIGQRDELCSHCRERPAHPVARGICPDSSQVTRHDPALAPPALARGAWTPVTSRRGANPRLKRGVCLIPAAQARV